MFFIYLIDVDIVDITSKFPLQRNPFHSEFVFHYYFFFTALSRYSKCDVSVKQDTRVCRGPFDSYDFPTSQVKNTKKMLQVVNKSRVNSYFLLKAHAGILQNTKHKFHPFYFTHLITKPTSVSRPCFLDHGYNYEQTGNCRQRIHKPLPTSHLCP